MYLTTLTFHGPFTEICFSLLCCMWCYMFVAARNTQYAKCIGNSLTMHFWSVVFCFCVAWPQVVTGPMFLVVPSFLSVLRCKSSALSKRIQHPDVQQSEQPTTSSRLSQLPGQVTVAATLQSSTAPQNRRMMRSTAELHVEGRDNWSSKRDSPLSREIYRPINSSEIGQRD